MTLFNHKVSLCWKQIQGTTRKYYCTENKFRELLVQRSHSFLWNSSSGGGLLGEAPNFPDKILDFSSCVFGTSRLSGSHPRISTVSDAPLPILFSISLYFGLMTSSFVPFQSCFLDLFFLTFCSQKVVQFVSLVLQMLCLSNYLQWISCP